MLTETQLNRAIELRSKIQRLERFKSSMDLTTDVFSYLTHTQTKTINSLIIDFIEQNKQELISERKLLVKEEEEV